MRLSTACSSAISARWGPAAASRASYSQPEAPETPASLDTTSRNPGTCRWIDRATSARAWSANSTLDPAWATIQANSPADSLELRALNTTPAMGNPNVASKAIETLGASTDTASPGSRPSSSVAPARRSQRSANSS